VKYWARRRWIDRWEKYKAGLQGQQTSPAQQGGLFDNRLDHHHMLRKAESSMATQLRSGKIGLNHFLYRMHVPTVDSGECLCGWRKQDVKHILFFCPEFREARRRLFAEAGTTNTRRILTKVKGIRAAARWMVETRVIASFSLAGEQLAKSRLPRGIEKEIPARKKRTKKKKKNAGAEGAITAPRLTAQI